MMVLASYNQNRTDVSFIPTQCADVLPPWELTHWAGQGAEIGRGWMYVKVEKSTPLGNVMTGRR